MIFLRNVPVNLKRYLPKFLAEDPIMDNLLDVHSKEQEKQRLLLDDISNQWFVNTATWGLAEWERLLQIIPRRGATYEERRRSVLLRLQIKQTSTLDFMGKLVARYLDYGKAYIEEHNSEYWFRVCMEGCLIDKPGLIEALELYKPAHLNYLFRYLLIGDTLKEDFSDKYSDDDPFDLGLLLKADHEEAYPYESYDFRPLRNGLVLHNGLHHRNGAEGPTIDRIITNLIFNYPFYEDMAQLLLSRNGEYQRNGLLVHGANAYPLDLSGKLFLSAHIEDRAGALDALRGAVLRVRMAEDYYPYGLLHGNLPIRGQEVYHRGLSAIDQTGAYLRQGDVVHGDNILGAWARGGLLDLEPPDIFMLCLSQKLEDNLQDIRLERDGSGFRGIGLVHGHNVYPFDFSAKLSLKQKLEDKTKAQDNSKIAVVPELEDYYPYGLKHAKLPIRGFQGEHREPVNRRGRRTRSGYLIRNDLPTDIYTRGGYADKKEENFFAVNVKTSIEENLQDIRLERNGTVSRGIGASHTTNTYPLDKGTEISLYHTPSRGWLKRDGSVSRGKSYYQGAQAYELSARRSKHNGVWQRNGEAIRGRAVLG